MRHRRGFSLAELVLIVLLLAVMAFVTVPRMQFATIRRQKADAAARKIATDLKLTRRLAVCNAAVNVDGYAMWMQGGPPYTQYRIRNLGTMEWVDTYAIDTDVSCTGGSRFEFGPLGNLLAGSDTQLTVSAEGKSFTITVVPATGAVKCVDN